MDTTSRMLRLLSLLQTHRHWTGPELAERLDVSARTLRRDIERLRTLGYEVTALRGVAGGYQLESGAALPPLLLDDSEAVAIAIGLRSATSGTLAGIEEISLQALAKLEQVLPARLRSQINALTTHTVPTPNTGPKVDPADLTVLAQTCRDQERVRFAYRSRQGVDTERRVEPYQLVSLGRRWYLVAWDLEREDWRTFRVDRLSSVVTTGWRFDPRPLPVRDAATYVSESIASRPTRYEATILMHAPADEVLPKMQHVVEGSVEAIDNETCILHARGDWLPWLAAAVTLMGVDFEVREPPELVTHFAELARRLTAAVHDQSP